MLETPSESRLKCPDSHLVHVLCEKVCIEPLLDVQLLLNWKVDLIDHFQDANAVSDVVARTIFITYPSAHWDKVISIKELGLFLARLAALEDEWYRDFKYLVLEILNCMVARSMNLKLLMRVLDEFIVDQYILELDLLDPGIATQYSRLLIQLSERGLDGSLMRKVTLPWLDNETPRKFAVALDLLRGIYANLNRNSIPFLINRSTSFPVSLDELTRKRSIHLWFKALPSTASGQVTLFELASSNVARDRSIRLRAVWDTASQLRIEFVHEKAGLIRLISVAGDKALLSYHLKGHSHADGSAETIAEAYTQLALTYDGSDSLKVFLNGELYGQSPAPELSDSFQKYDKLYMGNDSGAPAAEVIVRGAVILDLCLSPQWVGLFHLLGPSHTPGEIEFSSEALHDLLQRLSRKQVVRLRISFDKLQKENKKHHRRGNSHGNDEFTFDSSDIPESFTKFIIDNLERLESKNVLLNLNHYIVPARSQLSRNEPETQNSSLSLRLLYPHFLPDHLYSWGGSFLVVKQIELALDINDPSWRNKVKTNAFDLLLLTLNNDYRSRQEFVGHNGYSILASILRKIKSLNRENPMNFLPLTRKLLSHGVYNSTYPEKSMICDADMFRDLLLEFDIFSDTRSFAFLLRHLLMLLCVSKHRRHNAGVLHKLNVLDRFLQFLKTPKLLSCHQDIVDKKQLSQFMRAAVSTNSSVPLIKSITRYIIFALNGPENSKIGGEVALDVLVSEMCAANASLKWSKKFCRMISPQWAMLLVKYMDSSVIPVWGIRMLNSLLIRLGPHSAKRFLHVNNGLEILSSNLMERWPDQTISSALVLAAFDLNEWDTIDWTDKNIRASQVLISCTQGLTKLIIPEFLVIMNTLALNAMYTFCSKAGKLLTSQASPERRPSTSGNTTLLQDTVDHLNLYFDLINLGFDTNESLKSFYLSPLFLDSVHELLGHLKLSMSWEERTEFKVPFRKLVLALSKIFLALVTSHKFEPNFAKLSDLTKILVFEVVFPDMFDQINQYLNVSNYIFEQGKLMEQFANISVIYVQKFIGCDFYVSPKSLRVFINTALSILEIDNSHRTAKLRSVMGEIVLMAILKTSDGDPHESSLLFKLLLYRQMACFQRGLLSDEMLGRLCVLLIDYIVQQPTECAAHIDLPFSLLRTMYLINQQNFGLVAEVLNLDPKLVVEFFDKLMVRNDQEAFSGVYKDQIFRKQVTQTARILRGRFEDKSLSRVSEMIGIALHNGGKIGSLNDSHVAAFAKECEQLQTMCMRIEAARYRRHAQDNMDCAFHNIEVYGSLKSTCSRVTGGNVPRVYSLDYIENNDRMRKRMVAEDQLTDLEKISYNVDIPIKETNLDKLGDLEIYEASFMLGEADLSSWLDLEIVGSLPTDEALDSDKGSDTTTVHALSLCKNKKVLAGILPGDKIVAHWNVSQIIGLIPSESLMILGANNLYFVENFVYCRDGKVMHIQDAPPGTRDSILYLISSQSKLFIGDQINSHKIKTFGLETMNGLSKRHFLLRDVAIEFYFNTGASVLTTFSSTTERDAAYFKCHRKVSQRDTDHLHAVQFTSPPIYALPSIASKLTSALLQSFPSTSFGSALATATNKWVNGGISNFNYLMTINSLAGRTFNDLTQYPVFPWVLADYSSDELDLNDPRLFRDLSKPMGAQSAKRAEQFKSRYEALLALDEPFSPPFHYGTHFSSAMIVTSYLIRLKPYVQSYLVLQGGKFDLPERLFNSVNKAWISASRDNTTDVRELIPEFFYLSEFLENQNKFEFGSLQNGKVPDHVELPPWAKGNPNIFIARNREALESPYVSANLHLWIDLIFGHLQSGPAAVDALNVFHHLSYNGAIDLDKIEDATEKRAAIGQINNFGQTPLRVFSKPHPQKVVLNSPSQYMVPFECGSELQSVYGSKSGAPITRLEYDSIGTSKGRWVGRSACISSDGQVLATKTSRYGALLRVGKFICFAAHYTDIRCVVNIGYRSFLSASSDGIINAWTLQEDGLKRLSVMRGHEFGITHLIHSKSYNVGISVDEKGYVIVWDLTRFNYTRTINEATPGIIGAAISEDLGNIAISQWNGGSATLKVVTLNGSTLIKCKLEETIDEIVAIAFGRDKDHDFGHLYWSSEIIGVATLHKISLYELKCVGAEYVLKSLGNIDLSDKMSGSISAIQIVRTTTTDLVEKLIRSELQFIIGDTSGKVYVL